MHVKRPFTQMKRHGAGLTGILWNDLLGCLSFRCLEVLMLIRVVWGHHGVALCCSDHSIPDGFVQMYRLNFQRDIWMFLKQFNISRTRWSSFQGLALLAVQ